MAKKFQFRLDPLLNLRAFKVKEAKEALGHVANLRLEKEKEIQSKLNYLDELNNTFYNSAQASDLQARTQHIRFTEAEIKKLENEKKQLMEIEKLKRSELSEKMKEEKILEKLKEKKKNLHNKDILAEEIKILDEITTNKFIRELRANK